MGTTEMASVGKDSRYLSFTVEQGGNSEIIANAAVEINELTSKLNNEIIKLREASAIYDQDRPPNENMILSKLRSIIYNRQRRADFLDSTIFADPAWSMLLDLTMARLENRKVSVKSLCIAADVPTTTALRWIKSLLVSGQIEKMADVTDGRRSHIDLSDATFIAMIEYLKECRR